MSILRKVNFQRPADPIRITLSDNVWRKLGEIRPREVLVYSRLLAHVDMAGKVRAIISKDISEWCWMKHNPQNMSNLLLRLSRFGLIEKVKKTNNRAFPYDITLIGVKIEYVNASDVASKDLYKTYDDNDKNKIECQNILMNNYGVDETRAIRITMRYNVAHIREKFAYCDAILKEPLNYTGARDRLIMDAIYNNRKMKDQIPEKEAATVGTEAYEMRSKENISNVPYLCAKLDSGGSISQSEYQELPAIIKVKLCSFVENGEKRLKLRTPGA